jgi:hypothetical protein
MCRREKRRGSSGGTHWQKTVVWSGLTESLSGSLLVKMEACVFKPTEWDIFLNNRPENI